MQQHCVYNIGLMQILLSNVKMDFNYETRQCCLKCISLFVREILLTQFRFAVVNAKCLWSHFFWILFNVSQIYSYSKVKLWSFWTHFLNQSFRYWLHIKMSTSHHFYIFNFAIILQHHLNTSLQSADIIAECVNMTFRQEE